MSYHKQVSPKKILPYDSQEGDRMTEKSTVENRDVGHRWHISMEKELRIETGAKFPDKTVVSVSLEGNKISFEACKAQVENARQVIADKLRKAETIPQISKETA
jgi:hypothetical protein